MHPKCLNVHPKKERIEKGAEGERGYAEYSPEGYTKFGPRKISFQTVKDISEMYLKNKSSNILINQFNIIIRLGTNIVICLLKLVYNFVWVGFSSFN